MMNGFSKYSRRRDSVRVLRCAVFVGAATILGACGGANQAMSPMPAPSQPPLVTAATVNATSALAFTPSEIHLVQGGTVTFAFGTVGHNVFFDNDPAGAPANIPGVNSNSSVSRVFDTPGTYMFNCHIHPEMHGTVVVFAPDTL